MAKQRNKRVEGKLAEREKGDVVVVKGQDFSGIKKRREVERAKHQRTYQR